MQKTEDFIKKANDKHGHKYDYSKVEYGRNNNIEVIIICKKHGEFPQTPRSHLSGSGCTKCANNIPTTEEWIEKAKDKHGDKYDYSLTIYKSAKEYVIIICKKHKYEFTQTPDNHMNCTDGCDKCKHNYSPTTEEWIKRAKEKHGDKYDYSKVVYENCDEEVIIICKKHGEFRQTPNGHMHCIDGCDKCQDKYSPTTEEWIEKAKKIHGDKYDYSKVVYEKNYKEVIIICKIDGHGEFSQLPSNHVKGHGCRDCGYLETSKKQKFTKEEFTQKAKDIHGDKYDYSKVVYENCDENVIIICKDHGEFPQTPYHHVNDRNGCPTCAHITNGLLKRSNTEDFIEKAKKIHRDKYDYSKVVYEMWNKYVIIICKIGGHGEFPQTPNNHLNGKGCNTCSKKRSENLCRQILEEYTGLRFPSIKPDWLKNVTGYNLELDGFCEDLNLAFEYQGIQHYEYIPFFHTNGPSDFERQQERDKLKLELCKNYGVDVLIIPPTLSYQNENELRIFIKEELQKIVDCDFLCTD